MRVSEEPPVALRLMADYAADPVWTDEGMVRLADLSISARLRDDLREWAREWELIMGSDLEVREKDRYRRWLTAGRRHARDLQQELGPEFEVEYWHAREI